MISNPAISNDMPEITDFSKGRKNPYAEKIKKEGYSITIHYSPEDVAKGYIGDKKDIAQALIELMSEDEATRLLLHIKENYNLPCSPHLWEVID
jgi:hypothetical protein